MRVIKAHLVDGREQARRSRHPESIQTDEIVCLSRSFRLPEGSIRQQRDWPHMEERARRVLAESLVQDMIENNLVSFESRINYDNQPEVRASLYMVDYGNRSRMGREQAARRGDGWGPTVGQGAQSFPVPTPPNAVGQGGMVASRRNDFLEDL